ncbi:hypothetical protein EST38_g11270 [Candolleomyces aberdarensis]|uniref:DUF8021 domain-containing protein n=1 Tax=Candolleomyces aberdarensis TaxID=2316362 RepID=A0A4Q2D5A3_9AGAR|nr:hypothetical protein EST38_g11270 [Candolleomyces aberdarensis]
MLLQSLIVVFTAIARPTLAQCNLSYSALQQITGDYISSQATGAFATTASSATYTENFRPVNVSTGLLSRPLRVNHTRSIHDTTEQIDSIVTDAGDWPFNATGTQYYASREDWFVIPQEKRDTRDTIKKAGDAYLDLFNNPSVVVPWGTPCARLEGGAYTGRGLPTDSCNVGVPSGVPLTNRRYVIDETVGSVDVFLDFGNNKIPDSHEFRVEKGRFRFAHTMTATGGP